MLIHKKSTYMVKSTEKKKQTPLLLSRDYAEARNKIPQGTHTSGESGCLLKEGLNGVNR